ncbi:hypothetical protein HY492_02425 [Candidatus Woesearchaeota archaeon]|nr:hypothetical protein [Candidatus Woesearchaeota archaeon]
MTRDAVLAFLQQDYKGYVYPSLDKNLIELYACPIYEEEYDNNERRQAVIDLEKRCIRETCVIDTTTVIAGVFNLAALCEQLNNEFNLNLNVQYIQRQVLTEINRSV